MIQEYHGIRQTLAWNANTFNDRVIQWIKIICSITNYIPNTFDNEPLVKSANEREILATHNTILADIVVVYIHLPMTSVKPKWRHAKPLLPEAQKKLKVEPEWRHYFSRLAKFCDRTNRIWEKKLKFELSDLSRGTQKRGINASFCRDHKLRCKP